MIRDSRVPSLFAVETSHSVGSLCFHGMLDAQEKCSKISDQLKFSYRACCNLCRRSKATPNDSSSYPCVYIFSPPRLCSSMTVSFQKTNWLINLVVFF